MPYWISPTYSTLICGQFLYAQITMAILVANLVERVLLIAEVNRRQDIIKRYGQLPPFWGRIHAIGVYIRSRHLWILALCTNTWLRSEKVELFFLGRVALLRKHKTNGQLNLTTLPPSKIFILLAGSDC